jgi:hypothetical protein
MAFLASSEFYRIMLWQVLMMPKQNKLTKAQREINLESATWKLGGYIDLSERARCMKSNNKNKKSPAKPTTKSNSI